MSAIQADGDTLFPWWGLDDRAAFALAEIVFFLHIKPSS